LNEVFWRAVQRMREDVNRGASRLPALTLDAVQRATRNAGFGGESFTRKPLILAHQFDTREQPPLILR